MRLKNLKEESEEDEIDQWLASYSPNAKKKYEPSNYEKQQAYDAIIKDFTLSTIKESFKIFPKVVNELNSNKETLLHLALSIKKNSLEIVTFLIDSMSKSKVNNFNTDGYTALQSTLINNSFEMFKVIFDHPNTQRDKMFVNHQKSYHNMNNLFLYYAHKAPDAEKKLEYLMAHNQLSITSLLTFNRYSYNNKTNVVVEYIKNNKSIDSLKDSEKWATSTFITNLFRHECWDDFDYFAKNNPEIVYVPNLLSIYFKVGMSLSYLKQTIDHVDLSKFDNFDMVMRSISNYTDNYKIEMIQYLIDLKLPVTTDGLKYFLDKMSAGDISRLNEVIIELMDINKLNLSDNVSDLLMSAIKRKIFDVAIKLLDWDVDVNIIDQNQHTPLGLSCGGGNIVLIKKLISKGADVNYINKKTDRDIFIDNMTNSLRFNEGDNHIEILEILLSNGFKYLHRVINLTDARGSIFNYIVYCKRAEVGKKEEDWDDSLKYVLEIYDAMTFENQKIAFDYTVKYNRLLTDMFIIKGMELTEEFFEKTGDKHAEAIKKSPKIADYLNILVSLNLINCIPTEIKDIFLF